MERSLSITGAALTTLPGWRLTLVDKVDPHGVPKTGGALKRHQTPGFRWPHHTSHGSFLPDVPCDSTYQRRGRATQAIPIGALDWVHFRSVNDY